MKVREDSLIFSFHGMTFGVLVKDRFESDEVSAVLSYMNDPEASDRAAVSAMNASGEIISTYRPCYVSLSCSVIRGKMRVFVHITIEGRPVTKYNRFGCRRHKLGHGVVGCDIGTQTIAYTSDTEVGLRNLAERGSSVSENERKERLLLRSMDRSKRATNPDNYNADGTIRKGPKKWKFSRRYSMTPYISGEGYMSVKTSLMYVLLLQRTWAQEGITYQSFLPMRVSENSHHVNASAFRDSQTALFCRMTNQIRAFTSRRGIRLLFP